MASILTLNGNIVTNNGSALALDGYNWMGQKPEFIKQVYSLSTTLANTNFNTWTPSSTASNIKASQTLTTKETLNLTDYDYILYWLSDCQVVYDSTWSISAASCMREICIYTQAVFRRPSSVSSVTSNTYDYNASQQDVYSAYWCKYYNTTPTLTLAYTSYSPCYISAITAPTFSSTASSSPNLTIKTPVLTARCSSTYFSTANAKKVDKANSTVKMVGYLYRVEKGTSGAANMWRILTNLYNNPL